MFNKIRENTYISLIRKYSAMENGIDKSYNFANLKDKARKDLRRDRISKKFFCSVFNTPNNDSYHYAEVNAEYIDNYEF